MCIGFANYRTKASALCLPVNTALCFSGELTINLEHVIFKKTIRASSLDHLEEELSKFLKYPCSVEEDENGNSFILEQRQLFDRVGNIKINLYANEHAPPHFHISNNEFDASFTIESCELLNGHVPSKVSKKIKHWHKYAKPKLIEFWNNTRPSECPVGQIKT